MIIEQGAHRCNAYQTNRNVLLSEDAKADSIPNLEILTNDPVRCGHAASVGPVDEDTLFYIQSRGHPAKEAERLVVFGFFQEVLDRVTIPEVRDEPRGRDRSRARAGTPDVALVEVARTGDLARGRGPPVRGRRHEIAVVNLGDGEFRAVERHLLATRTTSCPRARSTPRTDRSNARSTARRSTSNTGGRGRCRRPRPWRSSR